jgi:hypothetical protein
MRYSTAHFIGLFILKANQSLIASVSVLPFGSIMFYYMFHAQLFLQPPLVPNRTLSSASALSCLRTVSLNPHLNHRNPVLTPLVIMETTA